MPESEEASALPPDATKTLVHGADGNYYVIFKNGVTVQLSAQQKNHFESVTLIAAQNELQAYFEQTGATNLASGVRIRIAELF